MPELRERLADLEHDRWARWQKHVHSKGTRNADGSLTIPAGLVERWDRQIATPYAKLSEKERDSDREEADRTLAALKGHVKTAHAQRAAEAVEGLK